MGEIDTEPQANSEASPLRHFLDLRDIDATTLRDILTTAAVCKEHRREHARPLTGKSIALIFGKPSTRTRVSFEVAIRELGGDPIILLGHEMQLGRGETVADTARVLSRYVDGIMLRTDRAANLYELARYSTVPVINGLTEASHPCQIMADILTFEELRDPIEGQTIAWCGDGNNVARSWIEAAARFRFKLRLATPSELEPPRALLDWARAEGADIEVLRDPREAVRNARCVITDAWVSMSDPEGESRHNLLAPYRVTEKLMLEAAPDAIFMHCLPAHRGEEVEATVIDGPQSVVFQEAENRLHAQKGILAWVFAADEQKS